MASYYGSHSRFYVSVDCIIFGLKDGKLSILLTRRAFEPEKGKWSLMGGFVRPDESVDAAAERVLYELTGLNDVYMRQVGAFGSIDRDPGERVVSVAYFALLDTSCLRNDLISQHGAVWVDLDALPELGFDHPEMIARGRKVMRRMFMTEPLAFRLLPELFTLTQMQSLYELVFGHPVDKRNFRKRVLDSDLVEQTDIIDKTSSRRGARMYRRKIEASFDAEGQTEH